MAKIKKTTTTVVEEMDDGRTGSARPGVLTLLLDRSGSMHSIKSDVIGGTNAYLDSMEKERPDLTVNMMQFDSGGTESLARCERIKNVMRLTNESYKPRGGTPLIDACMDAIIATDAAVKLRTDNPSVLVVFQTDGEENESRRYTNAQLRATIEEKKALGWSFVFLGAGIDSYAAAQSMGIDRRHTVSYGRGETHSMMNAMAANSARYYATGGVQGQAAFSGQQKTSLGDVYDKQEPDALTKLHQAALTNPLLRAAQDVIAKNNAADKKRRAA